MAVKYIRAKRSSTIQLEKLEWWWHVPALMVRAGKENLRYTPSERSSSDVMDPVARMPLSCW